MIFRNKNKYLMYKTLVKFNQCKSMTETQDYIIDKYKLDSWYFSYIISQCVEMKLIDGIKSEPSMGNNYKTTYAKYIYITYNGYEFLKNYYGFIKKVLWNLSLIFITAVITVLINNKFSNFNQIINISDNVTPKHIICSKICDNTN